MRDSKLRTDAVAIFNASLKAVDPISAVKKHVSLEGDMLRVGDRGYNLSTYAHIYVVGCGKAVASMSYALEGILQNRIDGGLINVKYGHTKDLQFITINEAGHPIPDAAGALADGFTIQRAERLGMHPLEYLWNNDSYHFFEKLDDLIKTGPTNTNVMDVRLVLVR